MSKTTLSLTVRAFITLAILGAAGLMAFYLVTNPAQTKKKEETKAQSILVETAPVMLGTYPVKIEVMGEVAPAREASIKARVSGEIIDIAENFIPGGFFTVDDEILRIDPADYELNVNVQKASVRQANAALRLELGEQAIARDELSIIEKSTGQKLKSSDLALRKPQLEQARANLSSAKAALELAALDLERTVLKAPFNGLVTARHTNVGNVVSNQDVLANFVSTDEYWITLEIPVHALRWLNTEGADAVITLDGGRGIRSGKILKVTGSINQENRLAELIVLVPDPLLRNSPHAQGAFPLVLGDYVGVTLIGHQLENAVRLPTSYLRDKSTVWLARNGKLIIQPVSIAYKDRDFVYIIKGLEKNDYIITSNIITPVNGMDVTVQNGEK